MTLPHDDRPLRTGSAGSAGSAGLGSAGSAGLGSAGSAGLGSAGSAGLGSAGSAGLGSAGSAGLGSGPPSPGEADIPLFPVGLVVSGRRCLVVGGGAVAARKIGSLVQCGALVTVVAPELHGSLRLLSAHPGPGAGRAPGEHPVHVELRPYRRGEAAGYRLVVAATGDPDVDAAVFEDAETAGVWVNAADDPAHCSVMLPAVWRSGPVTVSVSTGGTSPALASWLRTQVARAMGANVAELAALLGQARYRLKKEGRPTGSVDWASILDGPAPGLVAEGRLDEARAAVDAAFGWSEARQASD